MPKRLYPEGSYEVDPQPLARLQGAPPPNPSRRIPETTVTADIERNNTPSSRTPRPPRALREGKVKRKPIESEMKANRKVCER